MPARLGVDANRLFAPCVGALAVLVACAGHSDDAILDKGSVAGGKADVPSACADLGASATCDVCEEMGWYGDGECDQVLIDDGACAGPDPDCGQQRGCFETHLVDAIELNEHRRPLYAALTGDASLVVSNKLIASEKIARIAAAAVDLQARPWQDRGLSIVCDDFIDIAHTPPFQERVAPPPGVEFRPRSGVRLAARLTATFVADGFEGVAEAAREELEALEDQPGYHCSLRHFLESVRRAALLAPIHEQRADELGLPSPALISKELVVLHIASLPFGARLDALAAPIQAAGVPILCQDVPPIAVP